jgi:hypothetical protein
LKKEQQIPEKIRSGDRLHRIVITGVLLFLVTWVLLLELVPRFQEREWYDFPGAAGAVWFGLWAFAMLRSRSGWALVAGFLAIGMMVFAILIQPL